MEEEGDGEEMVRKKVGDDGGEEIKWRSTI